MPVAVVGSLCLGEIGIGPGEVVRSIFGSGSPLGEIALDSRAPRLCVALLGGACLAASGTVLQAAVRNPFAGPELAGVVGGASVGAFTVLLAFPDAPSVVLPFASFAGALVAMAAVLAFAGGSSPARLALVGIAVTAACAAVTELMLLHSQPAAATAITWLSGSTYATRWSDLRLLAVPAAVLLPVAFLAVRRLDVLMLDDELATALGLRVRAEPGAAAGRGRRAGRGGGGGVRGDRVRRPARAARRAAAGGREPSPRAADGDRARRAAAGPGRYGRAHLVRAHRDPVRPGRLDDRRSLPGGVAVAQPDGLTATGLVVGYGEREVLHGVDVPLPAGRITAIVGANASGKSTLLRAFARLLKPRAGSVLLDGASIASLPTREVARRLGFLPQSPVPPEGLTVADLVPRGPLPAPAARPAWSAEDREAVEWRWPRPASPSCATCRSTSSPAGSASARGSRWRSRRRPPVLLLDEPTTYLDLAHQFEVLDLLAELNGQGRTIGIVLHDLNHAARYAHHLVALREGVVHAAGPPEAIVDEELVRAVFGLRSRVIPDPVTGTPLCVPIGRTVTRSVATS